MKKSSKTLIIALGLGLIMPVHAYASEEIVPEPIDDEVIIRWEEYEHTKVKVKLDGVAKEIKAITLTPYSQYKGDPVKEPGRDQMLSLRDLATAVKGTDLRFDITKMDGEDFRVTTGVDYNGSDSSVKVPDGMTGTMPYLTVNDNKDKTPTASGEVEVVDSPQVSITWFDGEYYISPDTLELLDFRVSRDIDDPANYSINSDPSDIPVLTAKDFSKTLANNDYTVIYLYSPDLQGVYSDGKVLYPDFARVEDFAKKLESSDNYKAGVLGLIRKSQNYKKSDIEKIFNNGNVKWKNFGIDPSLRPIINQLSNGYDGVARTDIYDTKYEGYEDILFVVDKNGNARGKTFTEYFAILSEQYLEKEGASKLDKATYSLLTDVVYHNFMTYAIEGKEPSFDDIKAYRKATLEEQIAALKKAINDNNTIIGSATFLLEYTPQTIVKVKDKLVKQLETAKELQKTAEELIKELDKELAAL